MQRYVNAYELVPADTSLVDLGSDIVAHGVSALPANAVERIVTRPKLSRLRAAVQAITDARGDPIVSHLPRLTAMIAGLQKVSANRSPHMAFAFNFTRLPTGPSRTAFRAVLDRVDRFVTFSQFETELYPDYFGIERDRMQRLPWAQSRPVLADEPTPFTGRAYVCALGGEGRDYATLAQAAAALPDITFVVVARSYNAVGADAPNVHVLRDIAAPLAWRIAQEARAMVLPLLGRETCCGHITLVGAKLLGIPTVSTFSIATQDYVELDRTCPPGDPEALAELIRSAYRDHEERRAAALVSVAVAEATYSRDHWRQAIEAFLREH